MFSHSLRKTLVTAFGVVVALLVSIFSYRVVSVRYPDKTRMNVVVKSLQEHSPSKNSEFMVVDGLSFTNLLNLSCSVEAAYTNVQVDSMHRDVDELLVKCERIPPSQYSDIIGPITHALNLSFFTADIERHALTVEEFGVWISSSRYLIEALGKNEMKRTRRSEVVMSLEYLYLKRILSCCSRFEQTKRLDLLAVAEKERDHWIEVIDSPSSLTRNFAIDQFNSFLELIKEKKASREDAIKSCRAIARPLAMLLGRDPKWLDEFCDTPEFRNRCPNTFGAK